MDFWVIIGDLLSFFVVLLLIVHAILFGRQSKTLEKQAETLKDTVEQMKLDAIERASSDSIKLRAHITVTLEGEWFVKEKFSRESKFVDMSYNPTFTNHGQTPAKNVSYSFNVFLRRFDAKVIDPDGYNPQINSIGEFPLLLGTIGPNRSKNYALPVGQAFGEEELKAIEDSEIFYKPCFCGFVVYEDVFGKKWRNVFAWDIGFMDNGKTPWAHEVGPHNEEREYIEPTTT